MITWLTPTFYANLKSCQKLFALQTERVKRIP